MPHINNKGADQPAHLGSLISAFVVHCLDSITQLPRKYNTKFEDPSKLLYLGKPVCALPSRKPPKAVFLIVWLIIEGYTVSMFSPRGGWGGGDTLGIKQPKQSLPLGIRRTTLAQGQDLRCLG